MQAWPTNPLSARIIAYVIAGHHAGLADYGNEAADEACLARRLINTIEPIPSAAIHMPHAAGSALFPPIRPGIHPGLQFSMLTRMLFSCLVDADSLNSECFENPDQNELRNHDTTLIDLQERYQYFMSTKFQKSDSLINQYRSELLEECLQQAEEDQGLYTLTLPTGSGKTLTSLGFALKHAVSHGLRRIVYVIPYTSIIEQNAAVFRDVLGSENVLEHHSNVQHESEELEASYRNLSQKLRLAEENWDFPIVVTTNVQFFESLFANRRSRCRKLHNLAQSVIVLDEAQMMNGEFYKPCLYALEELVRNYGVTVVMSTATQPDISALFAKPVAIREMIRDVPLRFEQFKRVQLNWLGRVEVSEIADRMGKVFQSLCIVNTRRAARELYERLNNHPAIHSESVYHLSARMCPKHRQIILHHIRERLKNGQPCLLISTQLIECGVDVDFPEVYRELAGLDSIAQAAGRCNRNGRMPAGMTYVFETDSTPTVGWFGQTAGISRSILARYSEDPLSLEAIQHYFKELYFYQSLGGNKKGGDLTDKFGILDQLAERAKHMAFPFRTIAEQFQLIDTAAKSVIIPYDEDAENALVELTYASHLGGILRKLQPYVVQLYPQEFQAFRQADEIIEVRENVFKLKNPQRWYDKSIGVKPFTREYHASEVYCF